MKKLIPANLISTTLGMDETLLAVLFIVFATLTAVLFIIVIVLLCRGRGGRRKNSGATVTRYKPKKQKSSHKQTVGPTFVPLTETVPTVPLAAKQKDGVADPNADVIRRTNAVLQELNTAKPEKRKTAPRAAYEPRIKQPTHGARQVSSTGRASQQRSYKAPASTRKTTKKR